jgi:pantothenate kinase type III
MMKFDPQLLQQKYEQWRNLMEQLEQTQQQLQQAEQLWSQLQEYYQGEQWLQDAEQDLKIKCGEGHYSILGQDTLWNGLDERKQLALQLMRLSLKILES